MDPFLPTPPVNIIDAFSNAKNPDITTAKYRGNVFTSIFPNGSYMKLGVVKKNWGTFIL